MDFDIDCNIQFMYDLVDNKKLRALLEAVAVEYI